MQIRSIIRLAGIITAIVAASAYVSFRAYSIDERYTDYLENEIKEIKRNYNSYFTTRELAKDDISSFLTIITKRFNDISLIAVRGEDERPLLLIANNSLRGNTSLYNDISEDIYSNLLPASEGVSHTVKYYQNAKYYLFSVKCDRGSLTAVYPRKLPFMLALRLILETLFIIVIVAIIFGAVYLKYSPSAAVTAGNEKLEKTRPAQKPSPVTVLSADEYIMSDIEKCAIAVGAENISVMILDSTGRRGMRNIGWKDKRFYVGSKPRNGSIETRVEILEELATGSSIIREKGKRILLPVLRKKNLSGILTVSCGHKLTGNDISMAEKYAKSIAKHL